MISEEDAQKAAEGQVDEEMVNQAVKSRLLVKLREATTKKPDGTKAQKPSIIGMALGDSQLIEVWARLSAAKKVGKSAYKQIAWKIQNEWGLLKEYSEWHIERAIFYYEQRVFGHLGVVEAIPELAEWSKAKRDAIDKIVEKVDGMQTLSDTIVIQKNRIDMAHAREKKMGTPLPFVYKEIKTLGDIVDKYLHYFIELGGAPRQPIKVDLSLGRAMGEQARQIDQTVGRDPMLKATSNLLEMIKGEGGGYEIDVEEDDG